jgi:hypothetical protein
LPSQAQRQLQLSLEAHSRYITSLLEQSELRDRLPAHLVTGSSSGAQAALQALKRDPPPASGEPAPAAAAAPPASAGEAAQQPALAEQREQGGQPRVSPQQTQQQEQQTAGGEAGGGTVATAATAGTASLTGFDAPGTTVASVSPLAGGASVQPPSPAFLDLDAATAWETAVAVQAEAGRGEQLTTAGAGSMATGGEAAAAGEGQAGSEAKRQRVA